MNLNERSPASSPMWARSDRAAAGSRYSSTKRTISRHLVRGSVRLDERLKFAFVHLAEQPESVQRLTRLDLVDLRHGEADVNQHPVTDRQCLLIQQRDVDAPADSVDVDASELLVIELNDSSRDAEAHGSTPPHT